MLNFPELIEGEAPVELLVGQYNEESNEVLSKEDGALTPFSMTFKRDDNMVTAFANALVELGYLKDESETTELRVIAESVEAGEDVTQAMRRACKTAHTLIIQRIPNFGIDLSYIGFVTPEEFMGTADD